jgi:transposase
MRASLAGERDPGPLAHRRTDRCPQAEAPMAQALHGHWRAAPRLAWAPAGALEDPSHPQSGAGDRQLDAPRATGAERRASAAWPPLARPRKRPRNRPRCDGRGARPRRTGVDRTAIAGLDAPTALTIMRAIGLEMGRWPPVQHCTSWRGLGPHHPVAGGQVFSRRPKPWATRAAPARRRAAACRQRRQSALGACCRRRKARLGTPKAITATAPTLARLSYRLLKHGTTDVRQPMADDKRPYHHRMVPNVTRRAKALGYAFVQTPAGTPAEP